CTRLWVESDNRHRPDLNTPEVRRLDLAEAVLQLKSLEVEDVLSFAWLEPPTKEALDQSIKTLQLIGALDAHSHLTQVGRQMARFPMHPRLSRMILAAAEENCLDRACLWAAIISERDILLPGARRGFAEQLPGSRSDFLVLEFALDEARRLNFDPP